MGTPRVDSSQIARGNYKLQLAIDEAIEALTLPIVSYFFSITPERGRALWGDFRAFQKMNGMDYEFSDYIIDVVDQEPITRALMPEGCDRPHQEGFRPDMQALVSSLERPIRRPFKGNLYTAPLSSEQMLPMFLEEIYFGREESYQIVRKHHCAHCPVKNCVHHL